MRVAHPIRALGGLFVLAIAACWPLATAATVITAIDDFIITRSDLPGSPLGSYGGQRVLYRDSFSDGSEPPSIGAFYDSAITTTYAVLGSYPADAESGGKLTLDSSLGGTFTNANGGGRTLQRSALLTNTNPDDATTGLKQAFHTFSVYGLFDLTIPPVVADGYGILLNDSSAAGTTESIDLFVRREENGSVVIRFQDQDFVNGVIDTISLLTLSAAMIPEGADQIELQLERGSLATGDITAWYRFWDAGVPLSAFQQLAGTAEMFTNNGWARGGFFAVEAVRPVPEPATFWLLLAAAVGLLFARRRA